MVRSYTDEPVDPRVVDRALTNATRAPSAGFSQGWGFLVLDTPGDVRRHWAATADVDHPDRWLRGMMRAPVVVLPCSSKQAYLDRYGNSPRAELVTRKLERLRRNGPGNGSAAQPPA